VLDLEPACADMPTLCSTADHRTLVCIAVLRCRFKPSGSRVELTTEAGKVVVIEIDAVQPIKNVMQLALRPLVAFASGDIAISGRRRHNRVGKRCRQPIVWLFDKELTQQGACRGLVACGNCLAGSVAQRPLPLVGRRR
jgi:hypothetical protein